MCIFKTTDKYPYLGGTVNDRTFSVHSSKLNIYSRDKLLIAFTAPYVFIDGIVIGSSLGRVAAVTYPMELAVFVATNDREGHWKSQLIKSYHEGFAQGITEISNSRLVVKSDKHKVVYEYIDELWRYVKVI